MCEQERNLVKVLVSSQALWEARDIDLAAPGQVGPPNPAADGCSKASLPALTVTALHTGCRNPRPRSLLLYHHSQETLHDAGFQECSLRGSCSVYLIVELRSYACDKDVRTQNLRYGGTCTVANSSNLVFLKRLRGY